MAKWLGVFLLALVLDPSLFSQGKKSKEPTEKAVNGIVTDAGGNPVPGAVVQLKNTKTLQIRSFIAKEKGDYYFQGLNTDTDYEVKAESNGKTSSTRTISSFDSHPEVTINLQLK
jgi:hypothetical protein